MSKYRSSYKKPIPRWQWFLPGVVGVVMIVGLFFINANTPNRNTNPQTMVNTVATQEGPATPVVGAPRVSVAQDTFDYGTVNLGITIQTVFKVSNVGDQPLVILDDPKVQVVEGCCPPPVLVSSKVIQPGHVETLTLNFMMHQGMGGKHRFVIHLHTNDQVEPDRQLVILSNWI